MQSSLPGNDKQGADFDVFITLKVLRTQEIRLVMAQEIKAEVLSCLRERVWNML